MASDETPIETMASADLLRKWHESLRKLQTQERDNPRWEWSVVQPYLEQLHALAHELRRKQGLERAKWQP